MGIQPLPDRKLPVGFTNGAPQNYYADYWQSLDANTRALLASVGGLPSSSQLLGINLQIASYVLVLGDAGFTIEMNAAGANTLTVPPNSSVAFPLKTFINFVQVGAGQTTLTPGLGVTLHGPGGALKTAVQWAMGTMYQRATDEWVAGGRLTV